MKTYVYENKQVIFNQNKNEWYLKAEFYHHCKLRDIECAIEIKVPTINSRLDAMINFLDKQYVIELKFLRKKPLDFNTVQFRKYLRLGLPVIIITNTHEIQEFIHLLFYDEKFDNEIYMYNKILKCFEKIYLTT